MPALTLSQPASASAATVLSGAGYDAKFTAALPRPPRIDLSVFENRARIHVDQFTQQVLDGYPATTLYGYGYGQAGRRPSWPGPTIVAQANRPVNVTWVWLLCGEHRGAALDAVPALTPAPSGPAAGRSVVVTAATTTIECRDCHNHDNRPAVVFMAMLAVPPRPVAAR